ncbi:MAG: hypothetical protein KC468_38075, partial [Myxococcales bacterium]|nr:hypothetical protein [Myxococcales bacterium]
METLERRYAGAKGQGMPLRATRRLLAELRALEGSVAVLPPAPTHATALESSPAAAPRKGRAPSIRWHAKKWKDGSGDRYHEATGTVADTGIVFTATVVRRKGTHLRDQTVTLVGTRDGVEIGELPREHGTLPDAKKAARGWLRSWWTAPAPASTPPPKPAPEPEPAPAPAPPARKPRTRRANSTRTRKPSTSAPVQVVASALTSPGDGEFIATAPASQLIAAVEAAIKLTGTKREDRRGLGLLSVEGGRLYVTS